MSLCGSDRSSKRIPCQCKLYFQKTANSAPVFFAEYSLYFFLFPLKDKASRPAPQEPFLQPEQCPADHPEDGRPPEVLGRVSNSPADQYMDFKTLPHKQNKTGESPDSTKRHITRFHKKQTVQYRAQRLLTVHLLQDPPGPSAAVRQLPAPLPADAAQSVQDRGLRCG